MLEIEFHGGQPNYTVMEEVSVYRTDTAMPQLPEGMLLFCSFVRSTTMPSLNKYYICENFMEVRYLFERCDAGMAVMVQWHAIPAALVGSPE